MMPVGTNLTEWWIELQTLQCIRIIQQHDDKVCSQTNGIWVSTELIHIFCVWSTLILAGFNSRQLFKANTERTRHSFYLTKNKQDQWKYFSFDKQKNIKATSTVSKIYRGYYTVARRYEFYVLVANTISHEWAQRTCEILCLPREHKIHIFEPTCNVSFYDMETKYLKLPIFILFSSQVSRNSLKTFKSYKVFFFVSSLSKLSENSFTCSSFSKTNLLATAIILNNTEATTHSVHSTK